VTDLSFRVMCRKFGAEHCFFEMLDAKSVIYHRPKTYEMLKTIKKDSPISVQLLGTEPSTMLDAAQKILTFTKVSSLDINSACPAKKVIKKGAGAALLNNPAQLGKIIKKLSSKLKIPVSVKLRTGFYKKNIQDCVKTAKICQDNGASVIFIHGRTMSEGYSGDIDYESIRAVKNALSIPVIASGNIFNVVLAKKMFDQTGSDGILVARGAMGNPWIFKEIKNYLETGKIPKPQSLAAKKKALKEHLGLIEKYKNIPASCKTGFMAKVMMWYLKGVPNATRLREEICRVKSYKELLKILSCNRLKT